MNADAIWNQYNKFRLRKTKQFAPSIYRALQSQIKYYTETQDLINLPQQPMQEALTELYKETGRQWAMITYYNVLKDAGLKHSTPQVQIKRRGAIGLNEQFVQAILEFFATDMFNTVTNITETTRNFIREQVEQGIQQQLSLDEIINNMLSSGITKNRAALISRTETMKGANAASDIGADRTGLLLNDIWLSVRDHRTRRDHLMADNQTVPHGKPFIIGAEGYLMLRPGATKSEDGRRVPAKELCNCRCCKGYKAIRGADGLPLRRA